MEKIRDCADLVGVPGMVSGVYKVHPFRIPEGTYVYCDMDTDGGGWTVSCCSNKVAIVCCRELRLTVSKIKI